MDATVQLIRDTMSAQRNRQNSPLLFAEFIDVEAVDANLSQIAFADGSTARGVPKCCETVFTPGDMLVCISPDSRMPLMIMGVLRGNTRLYTG